MKGVGKSSGWSNQTYFRVNDVTISSELEGLKDIYPRTDYEFSDTPLTAKGVVDLIRLTAGQNEIQVRESGLTEALSMIFNGRTPDMNRPLLRGETAFLIDKALDPFNAMDVNIKGDFIR
jgi:hypothetical protein